MWTMLSVTGAKVGAKPSALRRNLYSVCFTYLIAFMMWDWDFVRALQIEGENGLYMCV
jgi:hypothetical protein